MKSGAFYETKNKAYVIDNENPMFGFSACSEDWTAHSFTWSGTEPLEMIVHNPHRFGNETAIDEMLANISIWGNIDFERDILTEGQAQRNTGLFRHRWFGTCRETA